MFSSHSSTMARRSGSLSQCNLFDICPLVAAKVRFATRKSEKSSSFNALFLTKKDKKEGQR
jgi:hypothetical protein